MMSAIGFSPATCRRSSGRTAFHYKPRFTKEDMQRAEATRVIQELLRSTSGGGLPLSFFVEAVTEHDSQLLDELQQLIKSDAI
jgi:hypothetical protein